MADEFDDSQIKSAITAGDLEARIAVLEKRLAEIDAFKLKFLEDRVANLERIPVNAIRDRLSHLEQRHNNLLRHTPEARESADALGNVFSLIVIVIIVISIIVFSR